jgi:hypothetical protein
MVAAFDPVWCLSLDFEFTDESIHLTVEDLDALRPRLSTAPSATRPGRAPIRLKVEPRSPRPRDRSSRLGKRSWVNYGSPRWTGFSTTSHDKSLDELPLYLFSTAPTASKPARAVIRLMVRSGRFGSIDPQSIAATHHEALHSP